MNFTRLNCYPKSRFYRPYPMRRSLIYQQYLFNTFFSLCGIARRLSAGFTPAGATTERLPGISFRVASSGSPLGLPQREQRLASYSGHQTMPRFPALRLSGSPLGLPQRKQRLGSYKRHQTMSRFPALRLSAGFTPVEATTGQLPSVNTREPSIRNLALRPSVVAPTAASAAESRSGALGGACSRSVAAPTGTGPVESFEA